MPQAVENIRALNFDLREIAEMAAAIPNCIRADLGRINYPVDHRFQKTMQRQIKRETFDYAPTYGIPELIETLHAFDRPQLKNYHTPATLITSGGQAALYATFKTWLNPGDAILTDVAAYPPYGRIARLLDATLEQRNLRKIQSSDLPPKIKILLINHPNNPTGQIYPPSTLQHWATMARQNDWLVVEDAVYDRMYYDDTPPESMASFCPERTLIIQSASKNLALPGIRIGWIHGEESHIRQVAKVHRNMNSCPNTFFQNTLAIYLPQAEEYIRTLRREMKRRRDALHDVLVRQGWPVTPPEGAIYLWADIPGKVPSASFVQSMIREAGISAMPGSLFGDFEHKVRFCFGALTLKDIHLFEERLKSFVYV